MVDTLLLHKYITTNFGVSWLLLCVYVCLSVCVHACVCACVRVDLPLVIYNYLHELEYKVSLKLYVLLCSSVSDDELYVHIFIMVVNVYNTFRHNPFL